MVFRVRGVISPESDLLSADLILISANRFPAAVRYRRDYATDLTVQVRNQKEIATVAAKIQQILPDTRPILRDEILQHL